MLHARVDGKMLVCYDQLFLKGLNLPLLHLRHLFDHVIARDKHGLEVRRVRKSIKVFDLALEVHFAVVLRPVLMALLLPLSFGELLHIRDE